MKIISPSNAALAVAVSVSLAFAGTALAQQPRTLKIQSAVPPSSTTQDALKFFAERVDKLTGGNLKIEALPGGAIVPPFEILDAAHKKVIDGAYGISYWWVGKSVTATLFANTPAGIAGMDPVDFIGWVYGAGASICGTSSTRRSSNSTWSRSPACRRARRRSAGSSVRSRTSPTSAA